MITFLFDFSVINLPKEKILQQCLPKCPYENLCYIIWKYRKWKFGTLLGLQKTGDIWCMLSQWGKFHFMGIRTTPWSTYFKLDFIPQYTYLFGLPKCPNTLPTTFDFVACFYCTSRIHWINRRHFRVIYVMWSIMYNTKKIFIFQN